MAICLVSAEPARAHVDLRPRLVEQGEVAELAIELPSLRLGAAPVRLEVDGPGVEVVSTRPAGHVDQETRWAVRARIDSPPGPLHLVLRAIYADGEAAEARVSVTVVPASDEGGGGRWWIAVAGAMLAIGVAAGLLIALRRRAW